MHELALCEEIIAIVEAEARAGGFRHVRVVRMEIGALACASPDAIRFCFDVVSRGSVAEGASLELVCPPGTGLCVDCGRSVATSERGAACPACGGPLLAQPGGDRMRVTELEVD